MRDTAGCKTYDEFVAKLIAANVGTVRAKVIARERFPEHAAEIATIDQRALEKKHEHEGDKLMQQLGFEVIRFSHPGKSKQTEGIADRLYCRRGRTIETPRGAQYVPPCVVWWEAKSATGEQRPGQKLFQELMIACGELYVRGTYSDLVDWLITFGLARRVGDLLEPSYAGMR